GEITRRWYEEGQRRDRRTSDRNGALPGEEASRESRVTSLESPVASHQASVTRHQSSVAGHRPYRER
ncbi:MAG: hypothetical protein ACJ8AV_12010, partial [Gemmatimonadales bacterium]